MKPENATPPLDPDANLAALVHHTTLPHTKISLALDRMVRYIGDVASWVWLALLGIIVLNVTMRYAFGEGRIEFEELQWHLYSIGFLVGLSYVLAADEHVRIDVLHERLSLRAKCWVELYGILLLLVPFLALIIIYAVPFLLDAWNSGERSQAPGGLGQRWIVKSFLLTGFALVGVAAFSRLTRVSALLFGAPRAVKTDDPPFTSAGVQLAEEDTDHARE